MNSRFRVTPIKLLVILFALIVYLVGQFNYPLNRGLMIHVLNVGQGDAILIVSPDQHALLIDVGPDITAASLINQYWQQSTLDLLVLSHFDLDHVGGLPDVLNKYSFTQVIANSDKYLSDYGYQAQQIPVSPRLLGCCVLLQFYQHDLGNSSNETSIALRVSYQGVSAFFGGDLPTNQEDKIADRIGKVSFLKVAHHGSKNSSSSFFLSVLQPDLCLISSGKDNKYGHPHRELLFRLQEANCQVMRTDEMGTLSLVIEAGKIYSLAAPKFLW